MPYLFRIHTPTALSFAAKNHDRQSTRLAATNAAAINARKAAAVDQSAAAAARQRAAARAARDENNLSQLNAAVSTDTVYILHQLYVLHLLDLPSLCLGCSWPITTCSTRYSTDEQQPSKDSLVVISLAMAVCSKLHQLGHHGLQTIYFLILTNFFRHKMM